MKDLLKHLALLLAVCVLPACEASEQNVAPTASPSPESQLEAAVHQEMFGLDSLDRRMEARTAVKDYLRSARPDWRVKGIALVHAQSSEYLMYTVAVDITDDKQSQVLQLKAWRMIADDGKSYWRFSGL